MVKYTKQTKEQLIGYLEKRGSSLSEAAKIVGTSRTTLTRYLEKGAIPAEWMTAIREALKDRKPVVQKKEQPKVVCSVCGKDISDDDKQCATNGIGLAKLGVNVLPKSGWYWSDKFGNEVKRQKMYRVCESCYKKVNKSSPKKVKGKVAVAKSK